MAEENTKNNNIEANDEQIQASLERAIIVQIMAAKERISTLPPMQAQGYTPDMIDRFVNETINFTSDFNDAEKQRIRNIYTETIANLPPWQQALVIEKKIPTFFGDSQSINKLCNNPEHKVGGFFNGSASHIVVSPFHPPHTTSRITVHEHGHFFDFQNTDDYFSDNSPAWKDALEREQKNGWRGEKELKQVLPQKTISRHISNKIYTPEEYPREAMAEMTAIYNKAYMQFGGDIEKTNALMSKAYPELFPVYRDEFMPHAMRKANNLERNITNEKLSAQRYILVSDMAEINLLHSKIKEIEISSPDGSTSRRIGLEAHYSFNERAVTEAKAVLKLHGINVTFRDFDPIDPQKTNYRQYLLFDNAEDAQKFAAIKESGNLLKHPTTHAPNVAVNLETKTTKALKYLTAALPFNLDNLIIASGVSAITAGLAYAGGASASQAAKIGADSGNEISGFASGWRAIIAASNRDGTEATLQLLDMLGIPINATRDMAKDIDKQIEFAKVLSPVLPKTIADAKKLENFIGDPNAKEMIKEYRNVLSLREYAEMDPSPEMQLRLNNAEHKFSEIFNKYAENPAMAKYVINELEKANNFAKAVAQIETAPHEPSKFTPQTVVAQKQTGITPT